MGDSSLSERLQVLRDKEGVIAQLTEEELSTLVQNSEELPCVKGGTLISSSQDNDYVYLVLKGEIAVRLNVSRKEDFVLDEVGTGELVGEMSLFLGGDRTASAHVVQDGSLLKIPVHAFRQLLFSRTTLWNYVADLVHVRLRRLKLVTFLADFFDQASVFDARLLRELEPQLKWLTLRRGEALFRETEEADAAYFLIAGRLHAVARDIKGVEKSIGEILSGEAVGEMALLSGAPRSATVYASRDSELVRISATTFKDLVERYPQLLRSLSLVLVDRLRKTVTGRTSRTASVSIGIFPADESVPLTEFAQQLKAALAQHGNVEVLSSARTDELIGRSGMSQIRDSDPLFLRLIQWLNDREEYFRCQIYQADPVWSPWTERCMRQADKIFIVGSDSSSSLPGEIESRLDRESRHRQTQEQILVLLHPPACEQPSGTDEWLVHRNVKAHHHVRRGDKAHYARLARCLVGESIGLVFSGGVARGFAHIGVIRALEEIGIPIDLVGGTSMGAMIGGQYVCGYSCDDMIEVNSDIFHKSVRDLTLPVVSLLKGAELWRRGSKYLSNRKIEDLWLPFFAVSSNLTTADVEIHRSGSLGWALRASGSLPGVWPPISHRGELLVDGAVLNNLPIDVMHEYCDGSVIAVDVSAPLDLQENASYGVSLSGWRILSNRLNPFTPAIQMPGISSIMIRAAELASVRAQQQVIASDPSDLYLRPPVARFPAMDFGAIRDIAQVGYAHAKEKIETWREQASGE